MTKREEILRKLTPAQKKALIGAFKLEKGDALYPRTLNMGVRWRLWEKGLMGERNALTKLGREIRFALLRNTG